MSSAWKSVRAHPGASLGALAALAVSGHFVVAGLGYLAVDPHETLRASDDTPSKASARPSASEAPPEQAPIEAVAQAVLERNIFDSTTGAIAWADPEPEVIPETEEGEVGEENAAEAAHLTDCTGDLALLAAVLFEREPERSSAVLRRGAVSQVVPLGGETDGATLLALFPTHAYVREANGTVCRLPLFKSTPPPAAPAPAPPAKEKSDTAKPRTRGKPVFSEAELEAGITHLGGDRYKVSRELLTRALADGASVVRGTKFLPQTGDKRNAGVKIDRVAEGTPLYKLGIRSGDILRAANGVDLSSPDGMLGAYAILKEQNTISLAITRGGSPKTLQYTIE